MQQAHRNASVDGQSDSPRRGAVRVFVPLTFDIKAHLAHEFFHRVFLIFGIFGKALHSLFPMHRIDESSSAKRSHLHALTEPDVHLSIHQALIVQPLSSTTRARTALAGGVSRRSTMPRLASYGVADVCISVAPNVLVLHLWYAAYSPMLTDRIARNTPSTPTASVVFAPLARSGSNHSDAAPHHAASLAASLWLPCR